MQFWKKILLVTVVTLLAAPAAQAGNSDLLRAMNATRADHGLAPLRADSTLARAARAHSVDMIQRGLFGHYGFLDRMQRFGVRGPYVGENVAWGVGDLATPAGIVRGWLASPSHRANLLSPRFRLVGLGTAIGDFRGHVAATVLTANFAGR